MIVLGGEISCLCYSTLAGSGIHADFQEKTKQVKGFRNQIRFFHLLCKLTKVFSPLKTSVVQLQDGEKETCLQWVLRELDKVVVII